MKRKKSKVNSKGASAGKPMRSNAKVKPGTRVGSMGYANKATKSRGRKK
jgi:hypothetical protein